MHATAGKQSSAPRDTAAAAAADTNAAATRARSRLRYLAALDALAADTSTPRRARLALVDSDAELDARGVDAVASDSSAVAVAHLHTALGHVPLALVRASDLRRVSVAEDHHAPADDGGGGAGAKEKIK